MSSKLRVESAQDFLPLHPLLSPLPPPIYGHACSLKINKSDGMWLPGLIFTQELLLVTVGRKYFTGVGCGGWSANYLTID